MRTTLGLVLLSCGVVSVLLAQRWDDSLTADLVARAIARRGEMQSDSTLRDFRARAHGFVFFLGQLGEGLAEPPRLVKSDELVLEVYWKAPGLSKQRIVGWRDRIDLPTDIQYHRDHLGIVQNNFGDQIRLGHGDEVRDVPHPLAPNGPVRYEYALQGSQTLRLPGRIVTVHEVTVRPRTFDQPRVLGSLFIDVETAELVLFRFSFTRAAYLDDTLEDISIVLESALMDGRYWLPRRQEIEIRRRTKWLDLPARGIIRGRWEIRDYQFNLGLEGTIFRGQEVVAAPEAVRDSFRWEQPLDASIRAMAGPAVRVDLESVREEIGAIAGPHAISGLATSRPGVGAVSDIIRFNRVEGATLGLGWILRPRGGPFEIRWGGAYGFGDNLFKTRTTGRHSGRRVTLTLDLGSQTVQDVGDELAIAPVLNSIFAQETGRDYGDYFRRTFATFEIERRFGARHAIAVIGGLERVRDAPVVAAPATGSFRPNPALGFEDLALGRLRLERKSPELAVRGGVSGAVEVEGGAGASRSYVRLRGTGRVQVPVRQTDIVARVWGGWGSAGMPVHRSFVMGGRGTLITDPFRAWGGRQAVFGAVEWRARVPFPAASVGPFLSTGNSVIVAPFVAAGWTGDALPGMPWVPTGEVRPVFGLAVEWFHRLLRLEGGVDVDGDFGFTVDVGRDLWGIL